MEEEILNLIANLLDGEKIYYTIKKNNNTIFPKDKIILNKINEIKKNKLSNLIYCLDNDMYQFSSFTYSFNNHNYYIEIIKDITKLQKLEMENKIDTTTCLYNKKTIFDTIDQNITNKNIKQFIIVMCDIDNFKNINDEYNHLIGDAVLKEVATIFLKNIDTIGNIGRYGGDEFIFILKNIDINETKKLMEKINKYIKNINILYNGKKIKTITLSFGIYEFKKQKEEYSKEEIEKIRQEVINAADEALYDSKEKGKNAISINEKKDF